MLGLPHEIVGRHPFPGPGLAIRILGEVAPKRRDRTAADVIIARRSGRRLVRRVWQAFAVLLPVRTVGVMGDERTYENVVAIARGRQRRRHDRRLVRACPTSCWRASRRGSSTRCPA